MKFGIKKLQSLDYSPATIACSYVYLFRHC